MNPIGIALAFLVFWSFVAIGTFLTVAGARRLPWGVLLALPGLAMVGAGIFATLVVIGP